MKKYIALLPLILILSLSQAQNVQDGLIFYFNCNEGLEDLSGNNIEAYTNASLVEDEFGLPNSAYSFNGLDDVIHFPHSRLFKPPLPATFRIKFKVDQFPSYRNTGLFINDYVEDFYFGMGITITKTHRISVRFGDGGGIGPQSRRTKIMSDSIIEGQWYNLIVVWKDVEDIQIYLECIDQEGAYTGYGGDLFYSPANYDAVIGVGDFDANYPNVFFEGAVDEIGFWNRALSEEEIKLICEGPQEPHFSYNASAELHPEISSPVRIYPHPISSISTIDLGENYLEYSQLKIMAFDGSRIKIYPIHQQKMILDKQDLSSGIYFYQVFNHYGEQKKTGKIIIQ